MSNFTSTNGITYVLDIKTKDVKAVRELIKYSDGKPVDLFEAAETGTLAAIMHNIALLIDVVFVLCLDQVKENFNLEKYDNENKKTYELRPELELESRLTKASRWFGNSIDGDTVIKIVDAFSEAIVNFIPSESRRQTLQVVLAKEKEIEQIEAELQMKSAERTFQKTKELIIKRWDQISETKQQEVKEILDGQFNSSTNTQE
ncbi:MAG: hypothetical protein LBP59_06125 [Planctomycetaceae bacterium]|jgi:hypothetical protein|nr:hypothetical protein [Planctomycetaceae bacterium]